MCVLLCTHQSFYQFSQTKICHHSLLQKYICQNKYRKHTSVSGGTTSASRCVQGTTIFCFLFLEKKIQTQTEVYAQVKGNGIFFSLRPPMYVLSADCLRLHPIFRRQTKEKGGERCIPWMHLELCKNQLTFWPLH